MVEFVRQPNRVIERNRLRQRLVQTGVTPEDVVEIVPTERVRLLNRDGLDLNSESTVIGKYARFRTYVR